MDAATEAQKDNKTQQDEGKKGARNSRKTNKSKVKTATTKKSAVTYVIGLLILLVLGAVAYNMLGQKTSPSSEAQTSITSLISTETNQGNKYLELDGVALANEYARIKDEEAQSKKLFQERLKPLEEAIIAYSKKEGVENIYGTDKQVGITSVETYRIPRPGTIERIKLEKYLKQKGLWENYSILNTKALEQAIKEGETDGKINKYVKKGEKTSLFLKRILVRE